ncbi:hypothetical protein FIM02_02855 [SAR202 cluster bacterium AD-802-E10_MRT_200m]|nr:hypothetical protein [SAR202 cluster bacterium AD-802-E10_MRT_200m]
MKSDISLTIRKVYRILMHTYGQQHWWPGKTNLDVCMGAILMQNTNWRNAESALNALKLMGLFSIEQLHAISNLELEHAIKSSGTYRMKARKIKAFIDHVVLYWEGRLNNFLSLPKDELRNELLSIYGIGRESADTIIVYAAGKASFIIDAYTHRIFGRLGLLGQIRNYNSVQSLFHQALGPNAKTFNEYHALIIQHGKITCRSKNPSCRNCSLLNLCPTGLSSF